MSAQQSSKLSFSTELGPTLLAPTDQNFLHIGPMNPWNVNWASFLGEPGWLAMEVRPGERRVGDSTSLERIGVDGYIDPFFEQRFRKHTIRFSMVAQENSLATQSGDWWDFFELHALPITGYDAVSTAGPLSFSMEWSNGSASNRFRIWRKIPTEVSGSLTAVTDTMLYELGGITEGTRMDFAVEFREHPTAGFVVVWMNGVKIVDYAGQFGYNSRGLYPQFRIYRNHRTTTAKALYKLDEFSSVRLPATGELLVNGNFLTDTSTWLQDWTSAPASVIWQSDGSGGGQAVVQSNGTANVRMHQEFATTPGATYQFSYASPNNRSAISIGTTRGAGDLLPAQLPGTYQFTATGTTSWVSFLSNFNGHIIRNLSVQQLP